MNKQDQTRKGIILALLTATISGIAIFYSKISVAKIPPLILTTSRNFYVGLIFFLYFILTKKINQLKSLKRNQLALLLSIGLIGGALPFYLFFTGLAMINPQTANLIHKTLFVWVTFLAAIFLKEKFSPGYLMSFCLIFISQFLIGKPFFSFGKGEIFVLLATWLWAIENVIAKKVLKKIESEIVGLFRMGIGSIILLSVVFINGQQKQLFSLNQNQLLTIFIGGTILFFYVFSWYKALKYAPASLVTLILIFSTVVGNFLSGAFLKGQLPLSEITASILISLAIIFIFFQIIFWPKIREKQLFSSK